MKLIFAGTPIAGRIVLEKLIKSHEISLVITRPDAPTGRKRELVASDVAQFAQKHGLPVLKTNKLTSEQIEQIRVCDAELAVVVAFGAIIPRPALDILPWWNLHFSILPKWRGASPLQHSLIYQEGQGVTVFELDDGLDTGPIVSSKEINLPSDAPAGELLETLAALGGDLLLENLGAKYQLTPQRGEASYAPRINRADARIDFNLSAAELQRRVYAFNPEPMSWCKAEHLDLRILAAKALGDVDWDALGNHGAIPGQLLLESSKVIVACGGGTRLELLEVQPAGGKRMSAKEWVRGFKGARLD